MKNGLPEGLIENGFDFLERAIQQFTTEPKYSVINFCAAIELLLKARLMHEHWSLIIATKSHPNIQDFNSGDFKSVNFNDLIPRITSVTGEKISPEIVSCFKGLANHRNKVMHFFHEAHEGQGKEKLLEAIAVEQCNGWFFLRRLLERWGNIFGDYEEKIDSINASMKVHKVYLDTVFERIKPEIERDAAKGANFVSCKRCKNNSSEEFKKTSLIYEYKCRVCLLSDGLIKLPCLKGECDGELNIETGDPDAKIICPICDTLSDKREISEILETNGPITPDEYYSHVQTNCALCCELGSVVKSDDAYLICTNCYYFTDNDIGHCGWCQENQIGGGDLEHSRWSGCEFCDGQAGHMKHD